MTGSLAHSVQIFLSMLNLNPKFKGYYVAVITCKACKKDSEIPEACLLKCQHCGAWDDEFVELFNAFNEKIDQKETRLIGYRKPT